MNEAGRIVADLQRKLAELDHRVWAYRREMTSEFEKYSDGLLREVPDYVSETVSQTMAQSINGFRSLYPDGIPILKSHPSTSLRDTLDHSSAAPRPVYRPVDCHDDEINLRSPHEHEKEFEGVFTPNYLPLLDGSSDERRSRSLESPIIICANRECWKEERIGEVGASMEMSESRMSLTDSKPTTPDQKSTDGFSTNSDWSYTGTPRRSALRPPSSSSKGGGQSPRRVRFNVAGEEVLPTSSPIPTIHLLGDETIPFSYNSENDENDMEDEETLEDEDEPLPKRISSSQALRLLSRRTLEDDGTVWTAVSAPADGSASVAIENQTRSILEINVDKNQDFKTPLASLNGSTSTLPAKQDIFAENQLPKTTSSPYHSTGFSPKEFENQALTNHNLLDPIIKDDDEDEEELFEFDEIILHPKRNRSPVSSVEESDQDDQDDEDDFLTIKPSRPKTPFARQSIRIQSPAVAIPEKLPAPITPRSSNPEYFHSDHPFSTPIVNPEIHAEAASLGALNTFVGSLDGRTGLDENKINSLGIGSAEKSLIGSLRAGRSPKSLTERMLLEDLMEEDWSRNGDSTYNDSDAHTERHGKHMAASFGFGRTVNGGKATELRYLR
ncbi:hypothetical protein K3495_g9222 [Podosphaera aphanis]|nr:hypothetical protein K3495_g9222 [Podosphaera aphanis]